MLKISQVDYRRDKEITYGKGNEPTSDLQVILNGKILEIDQVSLHYLKHFNLHPELIHKQSPHLSRLKFPFDYPLLHDPSTLMVIKPIISHKQQEQLKGEAAPKAMTIIFEFQKAPG
mmetsp:Transcript_39345/g.37779  ORF Transcript_39345/g.37779 Transcript_39345/m.37779 type:complete len:117 (+) Transcript_39345:469-819(+)